MSPPGPPPGVIPTLTEVVPWPEPAAAEPVPVGDTAPGGTGAEPVAGTAPEPPSTPERPSAPDPVEATAGDAPADPDPASAGDMSAASEDEIARSILADLQRQVDLALDVRLREALAPVLARATDALIRDARKELTAAMRDLVTRSVAQEFARRRDR